RRSPSPCRASQYPPVADAIFEDRDLDGYALDLFIPEGKQLRLTVRKRLRDVTGYCACNIMSLGRFFHARCDIDRAAIDTDRPFGVTLLADHDLAAMHPNAETRDNAELPLIGNLFSPDRGEHCVDRPQNPVSSNCLGPIPQRDQTVALIEIDLSAVVGDRLG